MRACLLASVLLLCACGDDSGSAGDAAAGADGSRADAPAGDGASRPDGTPLADGARADAGTPPSCGGLAREACEATAGCAPACVSLCDCTCPGPPGGHEGCGCEGCPATCFTYDECVSTYGLTACGDEWCDSSNQICVSRGGGIGIFSACDDVPDACTDDRTCDCLGAEICGGGSDITCSADPDANTIRCDCLTCP